MGHESRGRGRREPRGGARRSGLLAAVVGAAVAALLAACTPPTPPSPPADPAPPVIHSFTTRAERSAAPVVAAVGWRISDPNGGPLTCRVDADGDGSFEHEIEPCRSVDSVLGDYPTAGVRTLTLEVDDGDFPPVTATTQIEVGEGPDETYEITLRLDPGMRPEFREAFEDAARRWEEVIVAGVPDERLDLALNPFGFPPFNGVVDDVLIDARDVPIDGPGKILGRAGGFAIREAHWQPYYGIMEFDTADLEMLDATGRLGDVILHEMGHVLGLGTNYLLIGLVDGFPFDPHYTGRAGVAAHQELGGDRYVPLEDQGGLGTAVGHWRESVFGNELMTGYLNQGSQPLSRLTVAALADLGYGVDLSAADPYSIPSGPAASRQEPPLHLHTIPIEPGIGGPRR